MSAHNKQMDKSSASRLNFLKNLSVDISSGQLATSDDGDQYDDIEEFKAIGRGKIRRLLKTPSEFDKAWNGLRLTNPYPYDMEQIYHSSKAHVVLRLQPRRLHKCTTGFIAQKFEEEMDKKVQTLRRMISVLQVAEKEPENLLTDIIPLQQVAVKALKAMRSIYDLINDIKEIAAQIKCLGTDAPIPENALLITAIVKFGPLPQWDIGGIWISDEERTFIIMELLQTLIRREALSHN
ncbi:unnamed protein product [Caenorhabditis bovis]|uniref:Uncharacterized protein n=1 Tax=Caenorhabditis bovis TaxID=2654633 RepID=A0A8S1FCC0_9PELO|nr:unnamed protein product [Caenorhabditis bovis]